MENWSYQLCLWVFSHKGIVPAALVVASLNMLIQIAFDLMFGEKKNIKARGDRGE